MQTPIDKTPRQRKSSLASARKGKASLSDELRSAIDIYTYLDQHLELDPKEVERLAREAKAAAQRSVSQLEDMVRRLNQTARRLKELQRRVNGLRASMTR